MLKLFISSLTIYTSLAHPHPGWIYVGTPAPVQPGQQPGPPIIPDPNNIPPPPPDLPPKPVTTDHVVGDPGIPPGIPLNPPGIPLNPPDVGQQPPNPPGIPLNPPGQQAPAVTTTSLPPGVNTISTTTPPNVGPPGIGNPGLPFFETTSPPPVWPIITTGPPNPKTPPVGIPPNPPVPGVGVVTPEPTPHPTDPPVTPAPITPAPTTPAPTTPAPVMPTPQPTTTTAEPTYGPPLPGHVYGAYMQNCPEPTGTEQCVVTSAVVTDQTGNNAMAGQVNCNAAGDCCMCEAILCGSDGGNSCSHLQLSGEKAAYGVQNIIMSVDPVAGSAASATCSGLESCKNAVIVGNYVGNVKCTGRFGCSGTEINIINPAPGFSLECGVTSSCENAKITLHFLPEAGVQCDPQNPPQDILLGSIACIGVSGCKGMELTINNMGCSNVIIESIECRKDTCTDAKFNFYGTSAIGIQACELPATGTQPLGLERCFSQLRSLSCPDPGSCMNQQRTLVDPINGFMLACESEMSCGNAQYTIEITAAEYAVATEQLMIQCNALQSCQNAKFHITNDNVIPVYVEAFCNAERSCAGATFTTGPNVFLFDVECNSPELCMGCTINGQPCGGHYQPIMQLPQFPPIDPALLNPNPNPTFPQFPVVPAPPSGLPVFPQDPFPTNTNPTFPQFPINNQPVFPSNPNAPLTDPWSQPNPWAGTGPTFSGSTPTFTNPSPPINPNPVSMPIVPSPPTNPTQTNPNQPAAPAPPQPNPINSIPPPPWMSNPNPSPFVPSPPVQPIVDPWNAPNPFYTPWYTNNPIAPSPPTNNQGGPAFSWNQPPVFSQQPGQQQPPAQQQPAQQGPI